MATTPPSEQSAKYDLLVKWARDHGAYIHDSLQYVSTESEGVEAIIRWDAKAIEPHEKFMRISYGLSLSYLNAVSAGKPGSCYHPHGPGLPERFLEMTVDHDILNSVFLVHQYLLGEQSFWYPYIQILPQPHDANNSAIPLLWPDEDLHWLRGTHLAEEVPKKRREIEARWREATKTLAQTGWDISLYTVDLGLWAYYIFVSRSFPAIALAGDVESIEEDYQILVKPGVNLDDVPKILLPVFDSLNHAQNSPLEYDFNESGLGVAKTLRIDPGEQLLIAYDKDTQRFNNTFLLRDFGFVLPDNEFHELVLRFPFDLTQPMHPSHVVFSTASTVDEFYASAEETYFSFVTVRAPRCHPHGLVNPMHPVRALRHFHSKLVSMVSFKVATLAERAALRKDPDTLPSDRNQRATIDFLTGHMQAMFKELTVEDDLISIPRSHRQLHARNLRAEQASLIRDVLHDMNAMS